MQMKDWKLNHMNKNGVCLFGQLQVAQMPQHPSSGAGNSFVVLLAFKVVEYLIKNSKKQFCKGNPCSIFFLNLGLIMQLIASNQPKAVS